MSVETARARDAAWHTPSIAASFHSSTNREWTSPRGRSAARKRFCVGRTQTWAHFPPARFIPLAEDTGLIVAIGKWVIRNACEQNVAWQKLGLPEVVMSVNLSPRQFKDPTLLSDIVKILEETRNANPSSSSSRSRKP